MSDLAALGVPEIPECSATSRVWRGHARQHPREGRRHELRISLGKDPITGKYRQDDGTVAFLLTHRDRERKVAADCGVELATDAFVFSRRPGGTHPLRPDNCTTTFERLRNRAGLSGFSFKDATRHLAATRLIGAGVDVRTAAGRLGHARASTTLDIYSHFLPERDREGPRSWARFSTRPFRNTIGAMWRSTPRLASTAWPMTTSTTP